MIGTLTASLILALVGLALSAPFTDGGPGEGTWEGTGRPDAPDHNEVPSDDMHHHMFPESHSSDSSKSHSDDMTSHDMDNTNKQLDVHCEGNCDVKMFYASENSADKEESEDDKDSSSAEEKETTASMTQKSLKLLTTLKSTVSTNMTDLADAPSNSDAEPGVDSHRLSC
ncbi:hypothetical protein UPYG_G00333350 [Umbra pygmaea]|uniref:Uncharacterized protein n=1 Tax=Umbra pygmaea TaxID=75934 RepID=A0ABD0WH44_UMBPY